MISPGDTYGEVEEKVLDWLEAGVRMVIVANPRRRVVTVYRSLTEIAMLTEADTIDGGGVVPGWKMAIRDVFAKQAAASRCWHRRPWSVSAAIGHQR